jgi:hypothetical protein
METLYICCYTFTLVKEGRMTGQDLESLQDKNFKVWNDQGFIPGNDESEEGYRKRVEFGLHLHEHLAEIAAELPFQVGSEASKEVFKKACQTDSVLFGIAPAWVPLFFSNHQLTPWQAGCAWIFQLNEKTPTSAFLQIRSSFREKFNYLGIYNRDELLAHEMVHAARMMYHEPRFEEILAYRTSESKWRRWLGPIVQSHKESLLFIILMTLIILNHVLTLAFDQAPIYFMRPWFELGILTLLVGSSLARLAQRHSEFNRCLNKLQDIYKNKETAQHLIFRLRDEEIKLFGASSPEEIKFYRQSQKNFRWKFLNQLYPFY